LREHEDEIRQAGGRVAAIGLGDFNYARAFREDTHIDFPLLIDAERVAYKAAGLRSANILHLLRRDNAASRKRAKAGGFRQHKLGENPFQLGGSFIFGPGDVDVYARLSETFGDNAPIGEVVEALRTRARSQAGL